MIHPITDLCTPELQIYTKYSEPQLLHYEEPNPGIFIAESPIVIQRALAAGYEPLSVLIQEDQILSSGDWLALCGDVPIYTAPLSVLQDLTGYALTRGALCAMRRKAMIDPEILLQNTSRVVLLENVVNPTNIGAIFRSAATLGMDAVLLTPQCCDPLYRRSVRVSMGTVFQIPWTYIGNKKEPWINSGLSLFKQYGFRTAAMALRTDSVNVNDPSLMAEEKLVIIMGTEGEGLAQSTIDSADYTVCIPMAHGVDSLNVAAASAVAFWQLGHFCQ